MTHYEPTTIDDLIDDLCDGIEGQDPRLVLTVEQAIRLAWYLRVTGWAWSEA